MMSQRFSRTILLLLASAMVLSGCETFNAQEGAGAGSQYAATLEGSKDITLPSTRVDTQAAASEKARLTQQIGQQIEASEAGNAQPEGVDWVHKGTGSFVRDASDMDKIQPKKKASKGDITLNFENIDIREVVKVILGDTLKKSYILDPGVRGGVTMQTGAPIAREDLLPTLETLLRMNSATLVIEDGQYHVVPVAKAYKGMATPQLADARAPLPRGYSVLIRPLHNIGAEEMNEILKPLVLDNSVIRVDAKRNMLLLAGSRRELSHMTKVIRTFDVNWIKGLSVGFFSLENSEVADVNKDLNTILGGDAGKALGGLVRISPVESANGFLVVTPSPSYLQEIGGWIKRLDNMAATSGSSERMYVYRVRNGKAEDLASLLNQVFDSKGTSPKKKTKAELAPGLKTAKTSSKKRASNNAKSTAKKVAKSKPAAKILSSGGLESDIRIVADEDHNSLLIMAVPRDYEKILTALEELDIVPLQVHIEATIVEVLLKDQLKYGIRWFFNSGAGDYDTTGGVGSSGLSGNAIGDIKGLLTGFNWSMVDSTGAVRAVMNAFADDSLVNVLSAPSVMVLDNHDAMIQVGDEVPTISQSQATDSGVIQSVNYRDTGIILHVKPRVNPGGLVTMEISQEVSSVADTEIQTNQPTIQTRKIESTVAVQSGQTVVLGGLIKDRRTSARGGIPFLYKIPVLGALFGETESSASRTELVIVLTPRVIASAQDAQDITDDFRVQMQGLKDEFLREAGVIRDNNDGHNDKPSTGNIKLKTQP